ncbi:hypothetical protein BD309DRAFT_281052 [Dichomitus squalens]|nr:hypothetical protein BD309DRAFT_281052 [Dichomitus squalens]
MRRLSVRRSHAGRQSAPFGRGGSSGAVSDEPTHRSPSVWPSPWAGEDGGAAEGTDWTAGVEEPEDVDKAESVGGAADGVVDKDRGVDLCVLVIGGPCRRRRWSGTERRRPRRRFNAAQRSSIKPFPRALRHLLFISSLLLALCTRNTLGR